jgi:hypothetical protein
MAKAAPRSGAPAAISRWPAEPAFEVAADEAAAAPELAAWPAAETLLVILAEAEATAATPDEAPALMVAEADEALDEPVAVAAATRSVRPFEMVE